MLFPRAASMLHIGDLAILAQRTPIPVQAHTVMRVSARQLSSNISTNRRPAARAGSSTGLTKVGWMWRLGFGAFVRQTLLLLVVRHTPSHPYASWAIRVACQRV